MLREFRCTSKYSTDGSLVLDNAVQTNACRMPVQLPQLLRVNTLAAQLRPSMAYHVLQHELRLVLSYLDSTNGMLVARTSDLQASARQIGSFFTETMGVGMLTAAMHARCGWNGGYQDLAHFDVLPATKLTQHFSRKGVRPDLLFAFKHPPRDDIAGEARGRAKVQPGRGRTHDDQRKRLNQLFNWSSRNKNHQVTMAWTFTRGPHIAVDLFILDTNTPSPRPDQEPKPPPPGGPNRGPKPPSPEEGGRVAASPAPGSDSLDSGVDVTSYDSDDRPGADSLYETAPNSDRQRLDDIEVRGDWVPANLIAPSTNQMFVGVLRNEPTPGLREAASSLQDHDDSVRIGLFGRVLLATSQDRAQSPQWRDISERLGQ
ncbi:hypothetical protein ACFPN7_36320 [Amycolatopsis halotolerans]